jgi:hypothetical protein
VSPLEIGRAKGGDFWLRPYQKGQALVLELSGSAEGDVADSLARALRQIGPEMARMGATEVWVDFRRVSFFSSPCLKGILRWLADVRALPEGRRYRIRFITDGEPSWQRSTLPALQTFAAGAVTLEPPDAR